MPLQPSPPRLLVAVTSPVTAAAFLTGQLAWCREQGFEVHLVCSGGSTLDEVARRERVSAHAIPMPREIDLVADVAALVRLVVLMIRLRPAVVSVGTPTAGLLAGLAAAITRVPHRVYILRGLRLEGVVGPRRGLLWALERLACSSAHHVVCVSPSLRAAAVAARVVPARKTRVIGHGSSNGVDPRRFAATADRTAAALALRQRLGIRDDQLVVGFVGRLHVDKGLIELLAAHTLLQHQMSNPPILLVAGEAEGAAHERLAGVHVLGHVSDPSPCYHAIDVLALPTRREGFPNVVLEAACAGVPAVTTDATGAVDAVASGLTGLVVPTGNVPAVAGALKTLLEDPDRRLAMGRAASARAEQDFRPVDIWRGLVSLYRERPPPGRVRRVHSRRCLFSNGPRTDE